ncbi:MAG: polyprenyl diphosphate synthase [Burkholderiaceae bacterium]
MSSTLAVPEAGAIPKHVAIIMDGNGRWATEKRLPRAAGHAKGVDRVREIVAACIERGIGHLTLFAFSSENWRRPEDEVSLLMRLFVSLLEREVQRLADNGVRLRVIGDVSRFEPRLRELIHNAEARTRDNERLGLTVAANYGGRWDILNAFRKMLGERPELAQQVEHIDELALQPYLAMDGIPEPDLFIRTGGEQRISNFLLWQLAYTELYFTPVFWPDFTANQLDLAVESYRQRERRFGRTSAQVQDLC